MDPACTLREIEKPAVSVDSGSCTTLEYSAEQQKRLGVDARGEKVAHTAASPAKVSPGAAGADLSAQAVPLVVRFLKRYLNHASTARFSHLLVFPCFRYSLSIGCCSSRFLTTVMFPVAMLAAAEPSKSLPLKFLPASLRT